MAVILDGLVFGLQLAVLGVGISIVFGLNGILDLAYGAKIALAAIFAASLMEAGLPQWGAVVIVLATSLLVGIAVDTSVLAPAHRRAGEARTVLSLLVTLAVAFLLDGILVTFRPHTALTVTVSGGPIEIFGTPMRRGSFLAATIAVAALTGAFLLLQTTRLGRAIRCVIQDVEGAQLCGIEPSRVRIIVVALSSLLGGIVALTRAASSSVTPTSGFDLTILAIVVAVVGGLGRVAGALVAGVLLGLAHAIATALVGASGTWVVLLLAASLTIVLRPEGVLGLTPRSARRIRELST